MKIIDIREVTQPIKSDIRNAYIDFSKMTLSLVAVVTDVVRDGKPVVGYGFNSNGRYGQGGLIRERFAPRILEAAPDSLLAESGNNLDPHKVWAAMMTNEKPGGHGERSVAVGTIDMAVWDAVAKIEGKPLYQLLAERYGNGTPNRKVFVYAAGGYYYPGKDDAKLMTEMRSYLDRGYAVVKMKIGGASLADDCRRIQAVLGMLAPGQKLAVDANGRFDLKTAIAYANSDAAIRGINPELEDAVRILGGGRLMAIRRVVMPLLKRALAGAFILVFIPATRELSAAIFLYTTGTQVLSVLLFDKSDEGNFEILASIGLILVVITVALVMLGFRLVGRDFMLRRTSA